MRLRLFTSFAFRFALLLCLGCFSQSLLAQQKAQRIALVIGNDSYTKIPALVNARSDARAIAASLQKSGFEVILRTDLNDRGMREAVRLFKARLTGGTEAVFYFSGHGVQVGAGNYLLPVDIAPDSEEQVKDDGLALQKVLDEMAEQKTRFAVAIVDACRDNPFPKVGGRNIGAGKGLSASAPATGQMVLYAAGAGQTALDRLGPNDRTPNGVFTRVLLREMDRPGLPVDRILKNVRQEVVRLAQSVGREQVPALYDQSVGEFYFRGGAGSVAAEQKPDAAPVALTEAQREEKFWDDAKAAGNKEGFEAYLESYPRGRYVSLAKANIARLTASVSPPAPSTNTSATTRPNPTAPGYVFKDCPDCPEMVVIPAGRFVMGAAPGEEESEKLPENFRNRSQPQHGVDVMSFSAGKFEVTRGQYRAFVEATGRSSAGACFVWTGSKFEIDQAKDWRNPGYAQEDPHPVACVSWEDAKAYVVWLGQRTGKAYRLLTEAEWEYAARAGTTTRRFWGDDGDQFCAYANGADQTTKAQVPGWNFQIANCNDRYAYTAPVGSYRANAFGLYDMLGNVSEWTEDCWNEYYNSAPTDGRAWMAGNCSQRVLRGGSWNDYPLRLRAASRGRSTTAGRSVSFGFRVARTN